LPLRPNRWANIVAAIITIPWVVAGGSMILHYIFFATVEILGCLAILWLAWTWRAPEI
jgi:hypothetical protein